MSRIHRGAKRQVPNGLFDNQSTLCRERYVAGRLVEWRSAASLRDDPRPFGTYPPTPVNEGRREYFELAPKP